MATKFQVRRGSASAWSGANPILSSGEIGFETDTNKLKIGDGTSTWSSLNYFSDIQEITSASAYALEQANDYTDAEVLSSIVTASAAAAAYTDSEIAEISGLDSDLIIQTASAAAVNYLVDGAPEALDTLNELSAALNDNEDILETLLTIQSASSTYLTIDSASAIYATQSEVSDKQDKNLSIVYRDGSQDLELTDAGKLIEVDKSGGLQVNIPLDSSVNFPIGTQINILQIHATGQSYFTATSGVTLNATPGTKLRTQWSSATLIKRAANTWVAIGDLTT